MGKKVRSLTRGAIVAALYVALTHLQNLLLPNSASMAIQFRASEALCVLTFFTPAAIPGLTLGCLLSNLTMGSVLWDIVFGSLATLLGATGGYLLGRVAKGCAARGKSLLSWISRCLIPVPTVVANAVIVPFVLKYAYSVPDGMWFLVLTVGLGEVISAWFLGLLLLFPLERKRNIFL